MTATSTKGTSINYFKKEEFLLKMLGISFTGNESRGYKIYSNVTIALATVLYPILQAGDIFTNDFSDVDVLTYVFGALIAFIKVVVLLKNKARLGILLGQLKRDPFIPNTERGGAQEKALLEEGLWISSILANLYTSAIVLTLFMATIYSLIKRINSDDYHDWEFAFCPFTIVNVTYSPNFEIFWSYQIASMVVVAGLMGSTDLLISAILINISYQLKILQNCLRIVVEKAHRTMLKDGQEGNSKSDNECQPHKVSWNYLKKSVEDVVAYHLEIIKVTNEMEAIFSIPLLMVYLNTLIMLCFGIHHTSMFPLSDVRLLRCLGQVICMSIQILIVCYWGEQIMYESQEVGRAAYEANFVGCDLRFQKNLLLIIRRSRNSMKLTVGGFTYICLSTFTWVMRTSYSTFMVLRTTASTYNINE